MMSDEGYKHLGLWDRHPQKGPALASAQALVTGVVVYDSLVRARELIPKGDQNRCVDDVTDAMAKEILHHACYLNNLFVGNK